MCNVIVFLCLIFCGVALQSTDERCLDSTGVFIDSRWNDSSLIKGKVRAAIILFEEKMKKAYGGRVPEHIRDAEIHPWADSDIWIKNQYHTLKEVRNCKYSIVNAENDDKKKRLLMLIHDEACQFYNKIFFHLRSEYINSYQKKHEDTPSVFTEVYKLLVKDDSSESSDLLISLDMVFKEMAKIDSVVLLDDLSYAFSRLDVGLLYIRILCSLSDSIKDTSLFEAFSYYNLVCSSVEKFIFDLFASDLVDIRRALMAKWRAIFEGRHMLRSIPFNKAPTEPQDSAVVGLRDALLRNDSVEIKINLLVLLNYAVSHAISTILRDLDHKVSCSKNKEDKNFYSHVIRHIDENFLFRREAVESSIVGGGGSAGPDASSCNKKKKKKK